MKLKFLGTGASEAIPGLFCDCDICTRSMQAGGKNIRTRSQAIVDDTILIDFPPDTYLHLIRDRIPLTKIHTCIITHNHCDHLCSDELEARRPGFAHLADETPLNIYGTAPAGNDILRVQQRFNMPHEQDCVIYNVITPFVPFEAEGYTITALKADHDPYCDPVIYLIEKDGKSLLYANDTGVFPDETWAYLERVKPRLAFVSLDCTMFHIDCTRGHMGLASAETVKQRLIHIGAADDDTVFYLNHFSHNGGATYDDMLPAAADKGFGVTYDGLEVEI
jgi:phosphoribosyl 1,2-cyclic phosphate phosphodiesterase